jgi:hypothetical protein
MRDGGPVEKALEEWAEHRRRDDDQDDEGDAGFASAVAAAIVKLAWAGPARGNVLADRSPHRRRA